MHSQTRITVILATALVAAVFAAAVSRARSSETPGIPAAAPVGATAATAEPAQPMAAATGDIEANGEAPGTPAANQRTEVEVSPSALRVPLGSADRIRNRAAALARRLELSAADSEALLTVLLEEQARRAAAIIELRREPDDAEVSARVRVEFDAILAWKTNELRDRFGAERADLMRKRRASR